MQIFYLLNEYILLGIYLAILFNFLISYTLMYNVDNLTMLFKVIFISTPKLTLTIDKIK